MSYILKMFIYYIIFNYKCVDRAIHAGPAQLVNKWVYYYWSGRQDYSIAFFLSKAIGLVLLNWSTN